MWDLEGVDKVNFSGHQEYEIPPSTETDLKTFTKTEAYDGCSGFKRMRDQIAFRSVKYVHFS